jgi:hypothetical protein
LSELQQSGGDLLLRGKSGDLVVMVCNEVSMNSLAARLKRSLRDGPVPGPRKQVVLMRDARLKISTGAKKTREYLAELEGRGCRVVYPEVEALAALDALRSLLSDARSGDLSKRGENVIESVVAKWLLEHLDPKLEELADTIVEDPGRDAEAELERDLADLLLDAHLVLIDFAAANLGRTVEEVRALAERRPERFGVLQGPPTLLFEYVSAETLTESQEAS